MYRRRKKYIRDVEPKWGSKKSLGIALSNEEPFFYNNIISRDDWIRLPSEPEKYVLYKWMKKLVKISESRELDDPFRILVIGCGNGSKVIDLKRIFGRRADLVGVDGIKLNVDIANDNIKKNGVWAEVEYWNGEQLPFSNATFDAVFSYDNMVHQKDIKYWFHDVCRVLKSGGDLVMYTKALSSFNPLPRMRLLKKGIEIDPDMDKYKSILPKEKIAGSVHKAGFDVDSILGIRTDSFWFYPHKYKSAFESGKKFYFLSKINKYLSDLRESKISYKYIAGRYTLLKMRLLGKWLDSNGYVIRATKI